MNKQVENTDCVKSCKQFLLQVVFGHSAVHCTFSRTFSILKTSIPAELSKIDLEP